MSGIELQMTWLDDRRFADHALNPSPVWLWRADAQRILWANPTAAAIFDAESPAALATQPPTQTPMRARTKPCRTIAMQRRRAQR